MPPGGKRDSYDRVPAAAEDVEQSGHGLVDDFGVTVAPKRSEVVIGEG